jgi:IS30 family transposase
MSYTHLSEKEIISIEIYKKDWKSNYTIAKLMDRNIATIGREIKRYSNPLTWKYDAEYAIKNRKEKQSIKNNINKTRLIFWRDDKLIKHILNKIRLKYYSPEQVSGELRVENWIRISKDTIYKFIYTYYPELVKKYFRRKWRKYINNRRFKSQLPDRTMIDERPKIVEEKIRIWDLEWDIVVTQWWKWKIAVLTIVDRKSWFLWATLVEKNWLWVMDWMRRIFERIKKEKRHTLTLDNWGEFREHLKVSKRHGIDIYFAHPYSPWERWCNENANWLLRQFFPKWTDFSKISNQHLQYYVSLINFRPRKRLNFKSPVFIFSQ